MVDKNILELLPYKSGEILDVDFPVIDLNDLTGYKYNTLYLKKELQNISNIKSGNYGFCWKPSKSWISLKLLEESLSEKERKNQAEKLFNDMCFSFISTEYVPLETISALNLYLDTYDYFEKHVDNSED